MGPPTIEQVKLAGQVRNLTSRQEKSQYTIRSIEEIQEEPRLQCLGFGEYLAINRAETHTLVKGIKSQEVGFGTYTVSGQEDIKL